MSVRLTLALLALWSTLSAASLPLVFEQRDAGRFIAHADGGVLEFCPTGFRYSNVRGTATVQFPASTPTGSVDEGRAHYFGRGSGTEFPQFGQVTYRHVLAGLDLIFHGDGRTLQYDLRLAPGARLDRFALRFPDAQSLRVDEVGNLLWRSAAGEWRHRPPLAYQLVAGVRRPVEAHYVVSGQTARFAVGHYDRCLPLVIDPVLLYTDTIGGSGNDTVVSSATDAHDNLYLYGETTSVDFPVTGTPPAGPSSAALLASSDGHTVVPIKAGGANDIEAIGGSADGLTVYISAVGATLRSDDGGNTWSTLTPGLSAVAKMLAVDGGNPRTVYAATSAGLFKSTNGGQNWTERDSGLPIPLGTPSVMMVTANPSRAGELIATAFGPNTTFRSLDGASSWQPLNLGAGTSAVSVAFAGDHTVFATTQSGRLVTSADDGATWTLVSTAGDPYAQSLAVDPNDPSVLYLANGAGFLKSENGGITFDVLGLAGTVDLQGAFLVPGTPSRLYTRDDTRIYVSSDGGRSWNILFTGANFRSLFAAKGQLLIGTVT